MQMTAHRRKTFVGLGFLCVLVLGTAAVALRIRQHLLRVHAQHTLDNIQHLEVGSARTCELLSEWRKEWGSRVTSEGVCNDPNHFYMDIHAQNPPYLWPTCFERQISAMTRLLVRRICRTYEALSGKTVVFTARVEGVSGVVTRKVSSVFIVVPDDAADEDLPATVAATAETSVRFGRPRDTTSDVQQQGLHPSYRIFVKTSRANADYNPDGRVFYIEVEIGPATDATISERLFQFDLSCLTLWRPCSRHDLMPTAYDQYEMDVRRSQATSQ